MEKNRLPEKSDFIIKVINENIYFQSRMPRSFTWASAQVIKYARTSGDDIKDLAANRARRARRIFLKVY